MYYHPLGQLTLKSNHPVLNTNLENVSCKIIYVPPEIFNRRFC